LPLSRYRTSRASRRFFPNQLKRFGLVARLARAVVVCFTPLAAVAVGAQLTAAPASVPTTVVQRPAAVIFYPAKVTTGALDKAAQTPPPEAVVAIGGVGAVGGVDAVGRPLAPLAPQAVPTPAVGAPASQSAVAASVGPLKAVVIVGPSGSLTSSNLAAAEEFAQRAESYGMDVRRVFHPHATWEQVLANIQGANLVAYFGHGNSYPSPYGLFQEKTKDGFGLDSVDGASIADVTYYGANFIRQDVKLAPNAIVALSHLCYSAGNGEPGMALPTWDVARQRVDNTASGFLGAGAKAVFAYATGSITPLIDQLFTTSDTIDQMFTTTGAKPEPYYGFTGWDDRYFDSVRTPGLRNHLDPGQSVGFLRAVTGDLEMTAADWANAGGF